jgi:hypothetical protein
MIHGARRPPPAPRAWSSIELHTPFHELYSMRLWHLFVFILALSLILTIVRDQVGRIALIVFVTALGEVIIGTTAVLALFQTIGSFGEAKTLFAHAEALATTALVVIIGTTIMSSWLFMGAWLVQATLP